MGGIEPAKSIILKAIAAGAGVVTANKALLAAHGPELYEAADAANVDLYFEAAVAGAIPIIRPVRESLAGDHVRRILGIVNGTTNYVLDEMTTRGLDYDVAVKQAQDLGLRRGGPLGGRRRLRRRRQGRDPREPRVPPARAAPGRLPRGHLRDHRSRRRRGHRVRPRHQAARDRGAHRGGVDGGVSVRVHPALLPLDSPARERPRRVQRRLRRGRGRGRA